MAGKPRAGPTGSAAILVRANQQITVLYDKTLPNVPHIFSVPTTDPPVKRDDFSNENKRTPFTSSEEVRKLQYMTLISSGDRGVGSTQGNLEDGINAGSPGSVGSQTGTPNATKAPKVKLSISDYKNFKTTGVKPSPKTATPTPQDLTPTANNVDRKPMHSRNTSTVSVTTPMSRVSSFEGGDAKHNGLDAKTDSGRVERTGAKEDKHNPPRSVPPATRPSESSHPTANGQKMPFPTSESQKKPRPDMQRYDPDTGRREARAVSPQRTAIERKQTKRPLEPNSATPPEKRSKIEPRTAPSSISQKSAPKKIDTSESKAPLPKSQKSINVSSLASPLPKKVATPVANRPNGNKPNNTSNVKQSTTEKPPAYIPPLLSPLPADLTAPTHTNFSSKKTESEKQSLSSLKSKGTSSDMAPAKQAHAHLKNSANNASSSPLSTPSKSSPPFVLPRMLSPGLPDIVEAELERLQKKVTPAVESRQERPKPAPEVSRPKIGHPPKKVHSESNTPKKPMAEDKETYIVKIKYKKRLKIDIERILRLHSKPTAEFKEMERKRMAAERAGAARVKDEDSEEDIPLARNHGSKMPSSSTARKHIAPAKFDTDDSDSGGAPLAAKRNAKVTGNATAKKQPVAPTSRSEPSKQASTTTVKKRPADNSDRIEPSQKRPKAEDRPSAKILTPLGPGFKSPTVSTTAAREKALLSTPGRGESMRKSVAMSKVASSDGNAKTPQPTIASNPASAERPRSNNMRGSEQQQRFFNIGTELKRAMQRETNPTTRKDDSPKTTKLVLMGGIEGLMAYMASTQMRGYRGHVDPWKDLFPVFSFTERSTNNYKELSTLVCNLVAVAKEQSIKYYLEHLKDPAVHATLLASYKERDRMWAKCYAGERDLQRLLGGNRLAILGPWTTVRDAIAFGVGVLEDFATREGLSREGEKALAEVVDGRIDLNPIVMNGLHAMPNGVANGQPSPRPDSTV